MTLKSYITSSGLRPYLRLCGYQEGLLKTNFPFQKLSVPLAAFADKTYDARSACVAVLDSESSEQKHIESLVGQYRDLGAPLIFVCTGPAILWWQPTTTEIACRETIPASNVSGFFESNKNKFAPDSIKRAKTIGRLDRQYQLNFVDVGLMPLLEEQAGKHLSDLLKRMIEAIYEDLNKPKIDKKTGKWLFQTSFWLLAGKILKDKEVKNFTDLDLQDPSETLQCVQTHYHSDQQPEIMSKPKMDALQRAASILSEFANLRSVTTESLAYVYENTLINKEVRKALGIHATPSYLVDYIVWQLSDWINEIPQDKRTVLEPTCGHAPFLISAARLLREIVDFNDDNNKLHHYLKNHLFGLEKDLFASEIARLSLTLADIPNPNGWNLMTTDVYNNNLLQNLAEKSHIMLCNPPFQDFKNRDKTRYTHNKNNIVYNNKAAEVLRRTLPHMPSDSLFGVILPRSFLKKGRNISPLRRMLVENFEIREICIFPDNVFTLADQESTVILGRKRIANVKQNKIKYARVRERTLDQFKVRFSAATEVIQQSFYLNSENYTLEIPELKSVWIYCKNFDRLQKLVDISKTGKGLEYKSKKNYEDIKRKEGVRGYLKFDVNIKLTQTPKIKSMSLDPKVLRRPGHGTLTGIPQILLNSAPVSRGPWRLKALIDRKGRPFTSSFISIRLKSKDIFLEVLWAILNSPLANAYIYCHGNKWLVGVDRILNLPIPNFCDNDFYHIHKLVRHYFNLYNTENEVLQKDFNIKEAEFRMLAIDAEVMRLYNLPPKLERQVLNLFSGYQRKGVDFNFDRYYPEGFDTWIPLHEYLSEEFQRSSPSRVKQWVDEFRSPELVSALDAATKAFSEE